MEDRDAVHRLFQIMFDYVKEQQENREAGMRAFINSSSLYGLDVLREEISEEKDSVKLMTLHASKGLEFSCVFITGVNYGLIPLKTRDMDGEEEERRLFFVGITRAKDRLELSYYKNPGERAMPGENRYICMIPPRLLEGEEERGPGQAAGNRNLLLAGVEGVGLGVLRFGLPGRRKSISYCCLYRGHCPTQRHWNR